MDLSFSRQLGDVMTGDRVRVRAQLLLYYKFGREGSR